MCSTYGKCWGGATFNKDLRFKGNEIIRKENYYLSVEHLRWVNYESTLNVVFLVSVV